MCLLAIDYLLNEYVLVFIISALFSMGIMVYANKHQLSDKRVIFDFAFIFFILAFVSYFSNLSSSIDHIYALDMILSFNSSLMINYLKNVKEDLYQRCLKLFKVLSLIFVLLLIIGLVIPEGLINTCFYLEGRLSMIALLVLIFGPYIFTGELSYFYRLK